PSACPVCSSAATHSSSVLDDALPGVGPLTVHCSQCGVFTIDRRFLFRPQGWSAVPAAKRRALAVYLHATQAAAGQGREIDEQNWRALAQKGESRARRGEN